MTSIACGRGAAIAGLLWAVACCAAAGESAERRVVSPNEFQGTDVERINQAIDAAVKLGCRAVIPRVNVQGEERRDVWLLDSAIPVRSDAALEPGRDQSNKKPASVRG